MTDEIRMRFDSGTTFDHVAAALVSADPRVTVTTNDAAGTITVSLERPLRGCTAHPGRENHCETAQCGECWLCTAVSREAFDEVAAENTRLAAEIRELRDQLRDARKSTARAWSAWLENALGQTLEDGTPLLQAVFDEDPSLRRRFREAFGPRVHVLTPGDPLPLNAGEGDEVRFE